MIYSLAYSHYTYILRHPLERHSLVQQLVDARDYCL